MQEICRKWVFLIKKTFKSWCFLLLYFIYSFGGDHILNSNCSWYQINSIKENSEFLLKPVTVYQKKIDK